MTIATRVEERVPLPPIQRRAELRIEEQLRLENIRGLAGTHACPALHHIEELREVYRSNTPAFLGEQPIGGLYGRIHGGAA